MGIILEREGEEVSIYSGLAGPEGVRIGPGP
jgi:hypothetical protein